MRHIAEQGSSAAVDVPERVGGDKHRRDTLTRHGSAALARKLEKYWHDRGYFSARFWPELISERFDKIGTRELYRVSCNLVNGFPPVHPDNIA